MSDMSSSDEKMRNRSSSRSDNLLKTFLVDDHPVVLEAVRREIEATMDIEVCGATGSAAEAFRQIEELRPDAAIVDISLEDGHGIGLVQNISSQCEDVDSIVYSMYDEMVYAERAIKAGASGYLMKDEHPEELVEAIRLANDGEVYLSREMASSILSSVARGESSSPSFPIDEFTDRELAVFQMIGEGYSLEEIQNRLNLARKTVETYRRRAKEKLGFDTVSELLQFAVKWACAPNARESSSRFEEEVLGQPET